MFKKKSHELIKNFCEPFLSCELFNRRLFGSVNFFVSSLGLCFVN